MHHMVPACFVAPAPDFERIGIRAPAPPDRAFDEGGYTLVMAYEARS